MKTPDNKEQPSEQCSINLLSSRMCERGTACCETRHTQSSEHAMRAAEKWAAPFKPNPELAECIDQHAIAPAVAERDRRIAELERKNHRMRASLEKCFEHLGAEIERKTLNESAADGTQVLSHELAALLDTLAKHGGAHE